MAGTYVTLNISASTIRLLSVKGQQINAWKSTSLPPGLVKDGLITKPKVVGTVIGSLLKAAKVTNEQVIISLAGLPFTYRFINLPRMNHDSQREAIERAARKEMQLPLEELYLSWDAVASSRDQQDFFILGIPRNIVDAAVETLEEAGIKAYIMDIKPLALARAANQGDAIIVDLEPDCFDITIVANGRVSTMHTAVPRGEGSIVEYNIQRLSDELSKTVQFYNDNHPQSPLDLTTPLLLTGGLATEAGTTELIENATGYKVEPLTPPFKLPHDLPLAEYATNIGLAMKAASLKPVSRRDRQYFQDINVNILSGRYKAEASGVKLTSILLGIVLLIGIGLFYPVYAVRGQAALETIQLQTELTKIQQELRARLLAVKEANQIETTIAEIVGRTEIVKERNEIVLDRRSEFANDLELATSVLPGGATFTSAEMDSTLIIMEGKANSSFTVVSYATALEETGKFSEVRIARIDDNQIKTGNSGVVISGVSFRLIIDK
ncbi:pilus assembly protein PilM [Chloroflexota bacterium]